MSSRVKPPTYSVVVDVARRGADEDELREPLGLLGGCEHADHRADRVPDEDHVAQIELAADLEHIFRISRQRAVLRPVVRTQVGPTCPDVVEEHDSVLRLESRRDVPPHVLVAAEAVCEQHRLAVGDAAE